MPQINPLESFTFSHTNQRAGSNHPAFSDVKNKPIKTIDESILSSKVNSQGEPGILAEIA
jgi:hypothetical protein